jgi:hypothetical protein
LGIAFSPATRQQTAASFLSMEVKQYTVPEAKVALAKVIDTLAAHMTELSALAAQAEGTEVDEKANELMPKVSELLNSFFVAEGFMAGPMGLLQGFAALQTAVAAEKAEHGGESVLQDGIALLQGALMGGTPTAEAVSAMSQRLKA